MANSLRSLGEGARKFDVSSPADRGLRRQMLWVRHAGLQGNPKNPRSDSTRPGEDGGFYTQLDFVPVEFDR